MDTEQARNFLSRPVILMCALVTCTAVTFAGCRKQRRYRSRRPRRLPEPTVEKATDEAVQSLSDLATEHEASSSRRPDEPEDHRCCRH